MADQEFTTEELESEEWRPVTGYEALYSVSNLGRVRRDLLYNGRGGLCKPQPNSIGYMRVYLYRDNQRRRFFVHKLVATTFIGPCPEAHEVNHKDTVRTNNRLTNLEYLTKSGNSQHAHQMGHRAVGDQHWSRTHPEKVRRGERNNCAKLTEDKVREIRKLFKPGLGIRLARQFGISKPTFYKIIKRESWKHVD